MCPETGGVPADSESSTKGGGILPTPYGYGVSPYICAGDFPSVGRSTPPHHPISERTVPQSKAPLQGVNESLPPYPNGSPARRGIEFHDSPRPRSILEPSSGGRKSGCQRSQRSFAH